MNQISKFYSIISRYDKIAIVIHKNPDGDAIGSSLALKILLKYFGKHVRIYCNDNLPKMFFALSEGYLDLKENSITENLIFSIDCADFALTGINEKEIKNKTLVSIDHHTRSRIYKFSELTIHAEKSSTAEIIWEIYKYLNIKIDNKTADYLLLGIYSDTGGMIHSNVNTQTMITVSNLLECGGKLKLAMSGLKEKKNINRIKLWGDAIERLKYNSNYGILYTIINDLDIEKFGCSKDDVSGLVNFINSDKKINIFAVMIREHNKLKCSIRTEKNYIDVAKIAEIFNGGGHSKASGFEYIT